MNYDEKDLVRSIALRVANRDVVVNIVKEQTAYTDGKTITVGEVGTLFTTTSLAAHEGAHIRFGTKCNEKVLRHISHDYPSLAKMVLNVFEDYRVNSLNERIYKGFVDELRTYGKSLTCKIPEDKLTNTMLQMTNYLEYKDSYIKDNTYDIWERVDGAVKLVNKYLAFASSVIASKIVVDELLDHFDKDPEPKTTKSEAGRGKGPGKTKMPTMGTSKDSKRAMDIVKDYEAGVGGDFKRLDKATKRLTEARKKILDELRKMRTVPKAADPLYVKTGVKVKSIPLESCGAGEPYADVVSGNRDLIKSLRREFKRIMLSTNEGRGGRRGRISTRDIPRFVTSEGKFDKVFKVDRNSYGANLMIVLDESGSTGGPKINKERELVITLMEALKGTAINTCVIGFGAYPSKKEISEHIYKEFSETLDEKKIDKININRGYFENRDGDSFEVASKHFALTNHKNSMMIVVSDGLPSHGGTGYSGIEATKMSVRALRNSGIKLHSVGIDIYHPEQFREIYDDKDYTLIELEALGGQVISMVRELANSVRTIN